MPAELRTTMWKTMPHQISRIWKREKKEASLPVSLSDGVKSRSSSLLHRLFTIKPTDALFRIKEQQWDYELSSFRDLKLYEGGSILSFFQPHNLERIDGLSRIHMITIQKFRSSFQHTIEQQIHIHRLLRFLQGQSRSKKGNELANMLAGKNSIESILLNGRKPRRSRYVFMLLGTPVSDIKAGVHPITEATKKTRKPYSKTMRVYYNERLAGPTTPANYLLDPSTLHRKYYDESNTICRNCQERAKQKVSTDPPDEWNYLQKIAHVSFDLNQ